ncbi:MAG: type II secretion system protein [Candidatus Sericytochromatia bacterium]|nr:type II secretion system protein [Candidatus Sericytochromatia bacterium]
MSLRSLSTLPCSAAARARVGRRAGFTLLELMVVVGIVGTLAAVAYPNFQASQDRARNASMIANVKVVQTALLQYSADHNGGLPRSPDTTDTGDGPPDYSPAGSGLGSYLQGGVYPASPWSGLSPTALLSPGGTPLNSALDLANEDGWVKRAGTIIGAGSLSGDGTRRQPPTARTHYGALLYSRAGDRQLGLVYGVGKKRGEAVVAGGATSEGASAGAP